MKNILITIFCLLATLASAQQWYVVAQTSPVPGKVQVLLPSNVLTTNGNQSIGGTETFNNVTVTGTLNGTSSNSLAVGGTAAANIATNAGAGGTSIYAMSNGVWTAITLSSGSTYNDTSLVNEQQLADYRLAVLESASARSLAPIFRDFYIDTNKVVSSTNATWSTIAKYYSNAALGMDATGGSVTTTGLNRVHTFTSSSSFVVNRSGTMWVLAIGGGGGGGRYYSGGGGAGGYVENASFAITSGTYPVTIGTGGAAGTAVPSTGVVGSNTLFSSITAYGGGYGAGANGSGINGGNGGSGGGAGGTSSGTGGTASQGYAGGSKSAINGGSGGGGASQAGQAAVSGSQAGAGGNGTASSITGSSVTRAGGGGGSNSGVGAGGSGGGGQGASDSADGISGTANTGGGGGGGSSPKAAGSGGSGVVIMNYPIVSATGGTNATIVGSSILQPAACTRARVWLYHQTVSGTLGTNLQMAVGTYGTAMTNVSLGLWQSMSVGNIYTGDVSFASTTNVGYRVRLLCPDTTNAQQRLYATSLWLGI